MLFLFSYHETTLRTTALFLCFLFTLVSLAEVSFAQNEENRSSKAMQNLTARYNILFNAREAIKETQQNLRDSYTLNYNQLLPVLIEPDAKSGAADTKKLDEAIDRCKKIANEKDKSNYVDDAYLLIGMANHLKPDYYNSVEFFNYVGQNYRKEKLNGQNALIWKARSLMQLKRFDEAELIMDTVFRNLLNRKMRATTVDAYTVGAQLFIYRKGYQEAAKLLIRAIRLSQQKQDRLRWTYVLAQIEQLNGRLSESFKYYTAITRSNAPFEMYFNAKLNRISIQEEQTGKTLNREKELRNLLKDDKNIDFADQIYYQIAKYFESKNQLDAAVSNYNISLRKSTRNQTQKAQSYLALAELYFEQADYVKSKNYYDSTLTVLPKSHTDFENIRKKGDALAVLAKNLTIISEEDSLQALAALPVAKRKKKVANLIAAQNKQQAQKGSTDNTGSFNAYSNTNANRSNTSNKFYFSNALALSQGLSDFRTRWGNRQLEDNWRRSQKSITDQENLTGNVSNLQNGNNTGNNQNNTEKATFSEDEEQTFLAKIPDSVEKLVASNQRIADAWFEVGTYYREILQDVPEASRAFENLLKRKPDYENRAAVYYNLYRLYAESEPRRSEEFKQKVLTEFPNSNFAKVILDPEFGRKQDEKDLALSRAYEQVFQLFTERKYTEVQTAIKKASDLFGQNRLSAQLDYLNALSAGHQQSLEPFETSLNAIVNTYSEDKLITPLVKQHLEFIEANRKSMAIRIYALLDKDPNNLIWAHELNQATEKPIATDSTALANAQTPIGANQTTNSDGLFDLSDTEHFFMVINVSDPVVNLSSSRFGIGQFNRANLPSGGIKHQLIDLNGENQLIRVGEFSSLETVSDYYKAISPLMKDIMKIPAENYSLFLISKANLERIKDRQTLNRYLEFYQKNYK